MEWRDFLLHKVKEFGKIIQDVLSPEDHQFVHALVAGEPLYDLIYAFCSSWDKLTVDSILPALEKLEPEMTASYELNTEVLQGSASSGRS